MGIEFELLQENDGRPPRRRGRLRWRDLIPQAVCLIVALAVFVYVAVFNLDVDPGNLWVIPTVPLWISVVTGHVWRRAPSAPYGLEALALRRRLRRTVWRTALVLVFSAFALLWVASLWHWRASIAEDAGDYSASDADAGHYAFFAGLWWWPLPVAALLVLVQPVVFRLALGPWPRDLRALDNGGRPAYRP